MKTLPAALSASLASGVTTLCDCLELTRTDGVIRGFTSHDDDLVFEGVTFEAGTGFSPSAYVSREGLAVDTADIAMALSSQVLTEHDLAAGLWDEAAFRLWRVDWSDAGARSLELTGTIGEVSRGPLGFTAELRSAMHRLNRPEGRVHTQLCDANLGDARCGFALATAGFTVLAVITALLTDRLGFTAVALNALPDHRFKGGRISFSTGANLGFAKECKDSFVSGGVATVLLAEAFAYPLAPGDQFTITAGCDKTIATCHSVFANALNHRGFPAMTGIDFIASYPRAGEGNSGGSRE